MIAYNLDVCNSCFPLKPRDAIAVIKKIAIP
ncbi:hypothetical protein ACVME8_003961 [Bradyrhizobium diazoefficiens]